MTASAIMELENVLVATEGKDRRFPRDHEAYFVSVFGTPGDKTAWGWRLEGHHISLRFDVVGGATTASSPAFFGSNPAEVRPDVAAERMDRVKKAGLDNTTFAWAGETEKGKKHYYRVQGPSFLIEYDNTQNDGNHVHSVWRDFNGDFGRDLLREHLKSAHQ